MYNVFDLNNLISRNVSSFTTTETISARKKCFYGNGNLSIVYSQGDSHFAENSLGLCNNLKIIATMSADYNKYYNDTIRAVFSNVPNMRITGNVELSSYTKSTVNVSVDMNFNTLSSVLVGSLYNHKVYLKLYGNYGNYNESYEQYLLSSYNPVLKVDDSFGVSHLHTLTSIEMFNYLSSTESINLDTVSFLTYDEKFPLYVTLSNFAIIRTNLPTYTYECPYYLYDYTSSTNAASSSIFPLHLIRLCTDYYSYDCYYSSLNYTPYPGNYNKLNRRDFGYVHYDFGNDSTSKMTLASIKFNTVSDANLKKTPFLYFPTNSNYDTLDMMKSVGTCEINANTNNISIARRNTSSGYYTLMIGRNDYISDIAFSNTSSTTSNLKYMTYVDLNVTDYDIETEFLCCKTTLNSYGFCNAFKLTGASFPCITSMSSGCFLNCSSLEYIDIDNYNERPLTIGASAFFNCKKLNHFNNDNCSPQNVIFSSIGKSAFQYCSSLTDICITPNISNSSIGTYAFAHAKSLSSVQCYDIVSSFGDGVFIDTGFSIIDNEHLNYSIFNMRLPKYTFRDCSKLKEVNMYGVSSIEASAFGNCENLTSVEITASTVDDYYSEECTIKPIALSSTAFTKCSSLSFDSSKNYFWGDLPGGYHSEDGRRHIIPGMIEISSSNIASVSSGIPWGASNAIFILNRDPSTDIYSESTYTKTITAYTSTKQLTTINYTYFER